MSSSAPMLPPAEALALSSLLAPGADAIASRVLARAPGGTLTLFAFAAGQKLNEHTAPFDAIVTVLEGTLGVTVGGNPVDLAAGTIIRLPAGIPHAVRADVPARMLLLLLRDQPSS